MAAFPSIIKVFTKKFDLTNVVLADHVNDLQDEVAAIETILGTVPQGSASSVRQRLVDIEAAAAVLASTVGAIPIVPVGTLTMFAGASVPSGWLLCNGQSVLRAGAYASLYTALGGTGSPYGLPDGTHFKVPDLRGYFPFGAGAGESLGVANAGDTHAHGALTGPTALTLAQMPRHNHDEAGLAYSGVYEDHYHDGHTAGHSHGEHSALTKGSRLGTDYTAAVTAGGAVAGDSTNQSLGTTDAAGDLGAATSTALGGSGLRKIFLYFQGNNGAHTHSVTAAPVVKPAHLPLNFIIKY